MVENYTFLALISEGFGPRFGRVFGTVVASKTHATSERVNCVKTYENYGHAHKIMAQLLQQAAKIDRKSMKISMFFGTSISEAFWEDFGRVLGGQNPRFSQFF